MRGTLRIFLAATVASCAVLAARHVYTLSCEQRRQETLELELQSVKKNGEEVDDRRTWRRYMGQEIETTLRASITGDAELEMRTEDYEVAFFELEGGGSGETGGTQ